MFFLTVVWRVVPTLAQAAGGLTVAQTPVFLLIAGVH